MTSAPKSARIIEQNGPGANALTSTTRTSCSGPQLLTLQL
jgi:hypothetical protein